MQTLLPTSNAMLCHVLPCFAMLCHALPCFAMRPPAAATTPAPVFLSFVPLVRQAISRL